MAMAEGTLVDVDAFVLGTRAVAGVAATCAGGGMPTAVVLDVPAP